MRNLIGTGELRDPVAGYVMGWQSTQLVLDTPIPPTGPALTDQREDLLPLAEHKRAATLGLRLVVREAIGAMRHVEFPVDGELLVERLPADTDGTSSRTRDGNKRAA